MDTAAEALMRAMLVDGWFTASHGDASYHPNGFFGYVTNEAAELPEIREAFSACIASVGDPADADLIGSFVASIDADGHIIVTQCDSDAEAREAFERMKAYEALQADHDAWLAAREHYSDITAAAEANGWTRALSDEGMTGSLPEFHADGRLVRFTRDGQHVDVLWNRGGFLIIGTRDSVLRALTR